MISRRVLLAVAALVFALPMWALTLRTFVASTGTDVGSCTISAPCRSFAYAMTQVIPKGEIIALDTAGYGIVTINQSVAIAAAPGATAFIAVPPATTGVTVAASPGDQVSLRGLALSASGAGTYGITFYSGSSLSVENCVINNFEGRGIDFQRNGDTSKPKLQIVGTTIRNNAPGLYVAGLGPSVLLYATIANCVFTGSYDQSVYAAQNARVVVSDSVITGNRVGVFADGFDFTAQALVSLERCNISQNQTGVAAGDAFTGQNKAIIRLSNCTITGNDTGISAINASILTKTSVGITTNTIEANGVDGVPNGPYSAK